jgi:SecD/SecF fusion protein
MIDELELVKRARPEVGPPGEEARAAARRALDRAIAGRSGPPGKRRRLGGLGHIVPALGAVITIAVVVVFLSVGAHTPTRAGSGGPHRNVATGLVLVLRAEPTPQVLVIDSAAMQRAASVVRARLGAVASGTQVFTRGHELVVRVGGRTRAGAGTTLPSVAQVEALAATPARLLFYDWEANTLIPGASTTGMTVASQLSTQNPTALTISQGSGTAAPGSPGAGSLSLYEAVQLAARQPLRVSSDYARKGPEYFAFGASGSAACTAAAKQYQVTPIVGQHCYLAGPQDNTQDLSSALPTGVSLSQSGVQTLVVQQGTVVLQAVPASFTHELAWSDPSAQYYVLKDHVALFGNDITNPRQSTDSSGSPDVAFGFTSTGGTEFQNVTAQIARRGALVSGLGQTLNQHFAVALDTQLMTVPSIDFKVYPTGIQGNNGAEITGGFTNASARRVATELRLGALLVNLRLLTINGHPTRGG